MAETKTKNPAALLYRIGWIATAASAVFFVLFWATGLFSCANCDNAVTKGFARLFAVIGGFFGANTTGGGIPVLSMAGIGIGIVGILICVAMCVTFKKKNDKWGMFGSLIALGAIAILAVMIIAFDAARYYGTPARKFYGCLILTAGPAAVATLSLVIFLLIHYIIDCIDLSDCVVMVSAPAAAPAAEPVKEEAEPEVAEEKAEEAAEEPAEEKAEEPAAEEAKEEPAEEAAEEAADEEDEDEEDGETEEVEEQVVQPDGSVITIKKRRHACFETKLKKSDEDLRHKYYDLRDYVKSYGIKNRISRPGDTFSAHREKYVFLTIVGKHIRAYFALNPDDYANSPMPVEKAAAKKYEEVPCLLKVRSDLSFRRAMKLIDDVMKAKGVEKPAAKEESK